MNLQHVPNITATAVANAIEDSINKYELLSQHKFFTDGEYLIGEYMWALYYRSAIAIRHTRQKMHDYWTSTGKTLVGKGVAIEDVISDLKLMVNLMRGNYTPNN